MLLLILVNNENFGYHNFCEISAGNFNFVSDIQFGKGEGPWTTNHDLCVINSGRSMHWDHNNEMILFSM